ncbi:MAG: 50S ribosomal protein L18e [Candidatus Micrarchaeota archaeon]
MKRTDIDSVKARKENTFLISLIETLNREKKPIWKKVAYELSRPKRQRIEVNVSKLDEYGVNNGSILVPGKVLGSGSLTKKLSIAAFAFSDSARKSIEAAGGKAMSIEAMMKANPTGKEVTLLK